MASFTLSVFLCVAVLSSMTLAQEEDQNFCPPGWTPNELHCFKYVSEKKTWADAEMNCLLLGGNLASVWSEEDQKFQVKLQKQSGTVEPFWIGLSDVHKEGTWFWSDGTAVYYTNWAPGEPNNFKEEDCVVTDENWNDIACERKFPSICSTQAKF
ncbi:lactose-binding lectin l-2-like [Conger conger]|uniref:lactose-binding lectin l-2-like n=1 Tax=Conger conger TaxID=82655 RepID=UPI002A5ADDF4|nr:lactose-binding lectin l-2-like [Conger conger]XP_061111970.1 lactose-binding lectin l-2-like [Conger conger]